MRYVVVLSNPSVSMIYTLSVVLPDKENATHRREKVLVRLSDDQEEMQSGEAPCEWVSECHPHSSPVVAFVVFGNAACGHARSVRSHCTPFRGEIIGSSVVGEIRQKPEAGEGNHDAHNAWHR